MYLVTSDFMFIKCVYGTFTKIGHRISLNILQRINLIDSIFCPQWN